MTDDHQNTSEREGPTLEGNLELVFDLVFTFAMSQVTQLMLHDLSARGFGPAALALLAVWWAWIGYTWLINSAHAAVAHASAPLPLMPAIALAGGTALFYLADVAYRWRDHRQVPVDRTATGLVAAATLPALLHMPGLAALALLTAIAVVRLAWELWQRRRIGTGVAGQAR